MVESVTNNLKQGIRGIITFSSWGTSVRACCFGSWTPETLVLLGACSAFLIMNRTFKLAYGKRKDSLYVTASTNHTLQCDDKYWAELQLIYCCALRVFLCGQLDHFFRWRITNLKFKTKWDITYDMVITLITTYLEYVSKCYMWNLQICMQERSHIQPEQLLKLFSVTPIVSF